MSKQELFVKSLKRLLYENNLSQTELANRLGVTKAAVSSWVNGKRMPKMDVVEKIGGIYGVDTNFFFEEKQDSKKLDVALLLAFAEKFASLPDDDREIVMKLIDSLSKK